MSHFIYGQNPNNGLEKREQNCVNTKEKTQIIPDKTYDGLLPGTVAPDVVKVKVDYILGIMNGACVVGRGGLQTIIDLKGNPIVPWGQYKFLDNTWLPVPFCPFFRVEDTKTKLQGFINSKGEVAIPLIYRRADNFSWFKLAKVETKEYKNVVIDNCGNIISTINYTTNEPDENIYARNSFNQHQNYDRIPFSGYITEKKGTSISTYGPRFGFANNKGKVIIPNDYIDVESFSEGLAAVQSVDPFGVAKWGYIDKGGKLVIPYTFRLRPGHFHSGLAMVKPANKSDFDYAYIDKQGNIKIKIGVGDDRSPYQPIGINGHSTSSSPKEVGYFLNGFSFWNNNGIQLMDSTGNYHKLTELVKDQELQSVKPDLFMYKFDDLGIYFTRADKRDYLSNSQGMMDYKGNILIPPVFVNIQADYFSHYATATRRPSSDTYINGVVNKQGIYVLIIQEKSVF